MKEIIKGKSLIAFLIFMVTVACIQEQSIKNVSTSDTDNQIINKINYTLSVTQN